MYTVKNNTDTLQSIDCACELTNTITATRWRVRAIRGATTVTENTHEGIIEAVTELMETIEIHNRLDTEEIVSVIFSVTSDIDAIFPAAIARHRQGWNDVPLLDVQQMKVEDSLQKCIRVLIHINTPLPKSQLRHVYLQQAAKLRPDLAIF